MSKHDDIVARLRVLASEFPTIDRWMDNEWTNAADDIERLRVERDEAFILANQVAREAASIITAKIPSGKASAFWDALDKFRRFESRLPDAPSGREQENR